ncbi:uncharacterized protein Z519_10502 [Cladophialophora bantiana CBS 173.52]|uniref:NAD-dependent epimerase/dehydratase domain-containing protein n=1 Tax=Cladophialophora bantiana (strain ATCC 10958 / CBS 173.52 / CDC B-1940 / NIH 8579) TaxID=1442370 RepID=A0A0D2FR37_CLAB1|nr:uncharacterized protein Z519_10502 [Cladophialophora bantiana CBS 173.52]KIW89017.1 hypothetical protein Z519_10502 [Cladophialophora bantiana CBS 173.52]
MPLGKGDSMRFKPSPDILRPALQSALCCKTIKHDKASRTPSPLPTRRRSLPTAFSHFLEPLEPRQWIDPSLAICPGDNHLKSVPLYRRQGNEGVAGVAKSQQCGGINGCFRSLELTFLIWLPVARFPFRNQRLTTSAGKNVLVIGPGFIGWNVLNYLVREGYGGTGLVWRMSHGQQIQFSGANAVVGDLDDATFIKTRALENDGVAQRARQGKLTIYYHASGASVLDDNACGEFKGDKIHHDNNRSEIDSVLDDAPHRQIGLTILQYQKDIGDKAKITIMIPPLIYGYNQRQTTDDPNSDAHTLRNEARFRSRDT